MGKIRNFQEFLDLKYGGASKGTESDVSEKKTQQPKISFQDFLNNKYAPKEVGQVVTEPVIAEPPQQNSFLSNTESMVNSGDPKVIKQGVSQLNEYLKNKPMQAISKEQMMKGVQAAPMTVAESSSTNVAIPLLPEPNIDMNVVNALNDKIMNNQPLDEWDLALQKRLIKPTELNQGKTILNDKITPENAAQAYNLLNRMDSENLGTVTEAQKSFRNPAQTLSGSFAGDFLGTAGGVLRSPEIAGIKWFKPLADELDSASQNLQPNERDFVHDVVGSFGSMALFYPVGMGSGLLAKSLSSIAKSQNAIRWIASGASGLTESAAEAGSVYKEAKNMGASDEDARNAGLKSFFANSIIIPLTNRFGIFGDEAKGLRKALLSMPVEGLQESSQSFIEQMSLGKPIDMKEIIYSGIIGGVTGFGMGFAENGGLNENASVDDKQMQTENIPLEPSNPKNAQMRVEDTSSQQVGDKINLPQDAAQTEEILRNETTGQTTPKMQETTNTEVVQPTEEGSGKVDKTNYEELNRKIQEEYSNSPISVITDKMANYAQKLSESTDKGIKDQGNQIFNVINSIQDQFANKITNNEKITESDINEVQKISDAILQPNKQPEQPNVQEKRNQERKEVLSTTPEDRIAGQTEGAQAPSVSKQPYEMTREEWERAREEIRPNFVQEKYTKGSKSEAVNRINKLEKLLYGVNDEARNKLNRAYKGEIDISPEEAEKLEEQINTAITHNAVVKKALSEGKTVPPEVLKDYPDLQKSSKQPSVETVKKPEPITPTSEKNIPDKLISEFFDLKDQRKNRKGFRNKDNFNKLREIGKQIQQASGKEVLVDANDNLYIDKQKITKPKEKFTPVKVEDVKITRPEAKTSFEKLPIEEVDRQTFMADMFAEKKYLPVRLQKLLPEGFGQKKIDKGVSDIKQDAGAEQSKEAQIVRDFTKALDDELNTWGYFTLSSGQEVTREDLESELDKYIEEKSKETIGEGDTSFEFGDNAKKKSLDYVNMTYDEIINANPTKEQFKKDFNSFGDVVDKLYTKLNDKLKSNNQTEVQNLREKYTPLNEKYIKLQDYAKKNNIRWYENYGEETLKPIEKTKAGDLTSLKSETEVVKQKTDNLAVKYSKDVTEAETERKGELGRLKQEKRNFDLAIENTKNNDEKQNLIKERGKLLKRIDKLEDAIGSNNMFNAEENQKQQGLFQKAEPTQSQAFKDWFGNSKVVDDNGKPLIVYSGHSNTPLYENFDPKKATSGGFYATEDTEIANGYANSKFGVKEGFENGSQYRVKGKNGKYNKKLWQIELTEEQKRKIDELAEQKNEYDEYVFNLKEMQSWAEDNKRYEPLARRISYKGIYDLQNIHDYNEHMGYNIAYPKQGDDPYFLRQTKNDTEEIMSQIGIEWQSYDWNQPGVFPIYLSIQNPLDADKPFPQDLLNAIKQKAKGERARTDQEISWTTWTKDYPLKEWIKDIEDNSEGWTTQIPKKALPILKEFGYDGIKERAQKGSAGTLPREQRRINWVAFDSGQIKSVFNKGKWDYNNQDMLMQQGEPLSILSEKQLNKEIELVNKLLPNGFKVELDENLVDENGKPARAMFIPNGKKIIVNPTLADRTTIPHEIAHAGIFIVEPERASVILKAHGWDGKGNVTDLTNESLRNAHEKIAEKYEKYFNEKVRYNSLLERMFTKLKDLFTKIYNYAKGKVPSETEQYFYDLSKGKLNGTYSTGFGEPSFVYQKQKSFDEFMETEVGEQKEKDGLQFRDETIGEKLERMFINKNNRAKKLTAGVEDNLDFYAKMELYVQKASDQYEKVLEYLTDEKDGFLKRLNRAGFSIDEFGEYLWAKHATERNEAILNKNGKEHGSGMTDIEAGKILNKPKYQNSQLQEFEKEFRKEVIRKKLSILRSADVLTDEEVAQFDNYVYYVPLKGKAGKPNQILGTKKFSVSNTGIFEAKGRTSIPENPFVQAVLDLRDAIIRSEKNKVNQTFLKFIEENPNPNVYEVKGRKAIPSYNKHGEIDRYNKEQLAENEIAVYVKDKEGKRKQKVITIFDDILAKSMTGLGTSNNLKIMRKINDYLRTVVTIASPNFIITNFEKDLGSALINIGGEKSKTLAGKVLKDVPKAIKAFYKGKDGSGEYADWLKEYKSSGAKVGWMDNRDINELNNDFEKEIRNLNEKGYLRKAATKTIKFVENINQAIENGVRLSTYANLRKSGVSEQKAAQYAKDLTVNFERKGEYGELINTAYLFWNAGMQGSNRVYRALKSKNTRKIAGGLIALSLAQNLLNSLWDDDEYDKLSEWERDNHFIIMLGNGTHLKIKMPYGYNVFGVIGNITGDAIRGKVDFMKGAGRLGSAIVDAFNPFGSSGSWLQLVSPTVIDPVAQLAENKNFFGSPIYKEQPQFTPEVPSSQLYFKSVNPILRAITTWLNEVTGGSEKRSGIVDISPEIVEHVIEFIFGGAGKFVSQTAKTGISLFTEDETKAQSIPLVNTALGSKNEFYDLSIIYSLRNDIIRKEFSDLEKREFQKSLENAYRKNELTEKAYRTYKNQFSKYQLGIETNNSKNKYSRNYGKDYSRSYERKYD